MLNTSSLASISSRIMKSAYHHLRQPSTRRRSPRRTATASRCQRNYPYRILPRCASVVNPANLDKKPNGVKRMAAEGLIAGEEFVELRDHAEREEAAPRSRIDMPTEHGAPGGRLTAQTAAHHQAHGGICPDI